MLSTNNSMVARRKSIGLPSTLVHIYILSVFVLIVSLTTGCKTLEQGSGKNIRATRQLEHKVIEGGGWLSVFLNLSEPTAEELVLQIGTVEVKTANSWIPLSESSLRINTKHLGGGQVLIARNMVSRGTYYGIRLQLLHAAVQRDGSESVLSIPGSKVEMEFPAGLSVKKDDSHSLFVNWDVKGSVKEKGVFAPAMKTTMQAIPIISDLLFLACPEIETVYVLRTDKNWVISSLGVPGRPTYLEVDDRENRLYVLTPAAKTIKVIDLITFRIIDEIFITLDFPPSYMFFSADKLYAYVLDKRGKNIAKMNMLSRTQEARVSLSYQPQYGIYIEERDTIALSAIDTNKVYLLNPDSLISTKSFSVGSNPDGLLFGSNFIFVAESGSNTVTAYDLMDSSQKNRVNVGFSPRRLLLKENQIYVSNFRNGLITVMLPGQLNVSGEIVVGGSPQELAGSQSRLWLYAGDTKSGSLVVIDSTSNRINRRIEFGTMPLGMAIID